VTEPDAARFKRIEREVGCGYALTMKDLSWLVRFTGRLLQPSSKSIPPAESRAYSKALAKAWPGKKPEGSQPRRRA
jgi:hypothetical protein